MGKSDEKRPPTKLSEDQAKSHYSRPESPAIVGTRDLVVSMTANEHFSNAYQVGAQEKTKQAVEDTKQAIERTKRAKWETVRVALATLALPVMAFVPTATWAAALLAIGIVAPNALNSVLERIRDLRAENKKSTMSLPDLSGTSKMLPPSDHDSPSIPKDGKN